MGLYKSGGSPGPGAYNQDDKVVYIDNNDRNKDQNTSWGLRLN